MEGGPPRFRPRFTSAVLLRNIIRRPYVFAYGALALYGARFHVLRLTHDFVTPAEPGTARTDVLQPPAGNACPLTPAGFGLDPFSLATTQGVSVDFLSSGY